MRVLSTYDKQLEACSTPPPLQLDYDIGELPEGLTGRSIPPSFNRASAAPTHHLLAPRLVPLVAPLSMMYV